MSLPTRVLRSLLLRISESRFLREHLTSVPGVRRGVHRFMPGETADDALRAAEEVERLPAHAILTLLGEGVETPEGADGVLAEYRALLEAAAARGVGVELSVKPSQLGLDIDEVATGRRLEDLSRRCGEHGGYLWIDMEGSATVDATLRLVHRLLDAGGGVGVCLQAYLRRSPADLEALLSMGGAGVRLVKGAYAEPPDVAFEVGGPVDRAYLELGRRMLEAAGDGAHGADGAGGAGGAGRGVRAVFGTHDSNLVDALAGEARSRGVELEVHTLYGIRPELQRRIASGPGSRLGILVSYGPAWFPWYVRRLAERPANLAFALRQLVSREA